MKKKSSLKTDNNRYRKITVNIDGNQFEPLHNAFEYIRSFEEQA